MFDRQKQLSVTAERPAVRSMHDAAIFRTDVRADCNDGTPPADATTERNDAQPNRRNIMKPNELRFFAIQSQ